MWVVLHKICFTYKVSYFHLKHNRYPINGVYSDIASGISFEKRKYFFELLDEIMDHKVERVIIAYKDRLSRVGFDLFHYFFKRFGTEITVVSEVG
uniref:Resolvase/invertase-type recombinase catalytic domain-containing protein n=1 Tax=Candidatus Methanophaga sp. ANME-1 ERB7 TaxID=2759913 RepID=A0A7G9Z1N3_9EURY|nr:hypothetical protein KDLAIDDE_00004 [Methanosarcinales archaeon ANME-1 ERB7]